MGADPAPAAPPTGALARRLGTGDAVVVGLAAMLGAGVFAVWAPAARVAGVGLLLGLAVAAAVAFCNAVASAQLAAASPRAGGTYVYGRERLGAWWGFAAGWAFVVGKTASCAAMALTVAAYAVDGPVWVQRGAALVAVAAMTLLDLGGVTRTARAARVLVVGTLLVLGTLVGAVLVSGSASPDRLAGWDEVGPYEVLQSAGLLFFAFAGYARIATLGEEVRDPARTIPRAVPLALGIAVVVYAAVGTAALAAIGVERLAASSSPLATVASEVAPALGPLVRVGAVVAALGALLALLAGIGRTGLAMAREGDLPRGLAAVHPRTAVPHRAILAVAAAVAVLVLTTDLRGALGFSSYGVLLYYAIANASAWTQPATERRWPRALNVAGLVGCLVLAATLPWGSVVTGTVVLAVGLTGRALVRRRARPPRPPDGADAR